MIAYTYVKILTFYLNLKVIEATKYKFNILTLKLKIIANNFIMRNPKALNEEQEITKFNKNRSFIHT